MLPLAAAHHHTTLFIGIAWIVIAALHLVFRNFYARRATAMQQARRQTAPGFAQRLNPVWSQSANRTMNTGISFAMLALGIVFIVIGLA